MVHDKELAFVLIRCDAPYLLPDSEGEKRLVLVHQHSGGFWHEDHADQHDGTEDQRATEHIPPRAGTDVDEHSSPTFMG